MTTDIQPTREPTARRTSTATGRRPWRAALAALGVALLAALALVVVGGSDPAVTQPPPVAAPADDSAGGDDRTAGFDHEHQGLRDRARAASAADRRVEFDHEVQRFRNAVDAGRR